MTLPGPTRAPANAQPIRPAAAALKTRLLRLYFRTLGRLQPGLAAKQAEALFVRTTRHAPRPREMAFLNRAETFSFEARGERLQGYRWGDSGPVILCVHGWASHAGRFVGLADAALRAGYRVVAFDAPGHGQSEGRQSTMPEFAEAIRAVLARIGPVRGIVGHSLGGSAAIFALSRGAEAESAAVIAAPADVTVWLLRFREMMGLPKPLFERLRRNLERRLGVTWEELGLPALTAGIRQRGLIIHDREDPDVPWEDGAALAANWPSAALITTHGLGHRLVLRNEAVIEAVIEFFNEVGTLPLPDPA